MCRLAGTIHYDHDIVVRMTEHQQRGGPDGTGFYSYESVCFGHNRLAIVDVENGAQPMQSGRWAIVFVGEIYNHMKLRQELIINWPNHSDTFTLLHLIEHKGIEWTLSHIEGMYAFAAYDKYEQKIYLAVDPFGIKNIFYCHEAGKFAFASSPAALTYTREKWKLNLFHLNQCIALGATGQPLFSGIFRLDGGHYIEYNVRTNEFDTHRYRYDSSSKEDILSLVKDSIQSVRMSDVPIHLFLSGGIDSTTIASQLYGVNAVHLDSPELKYAQEVAEKYRNNLLVISPTNYNAAQCLEDYSHQSGDCSAAAIIPYMVSKEVSKLGKVAISANGADELFFGYDRMEEHPGEKQFKHIFRSITHAWPRYQTTQEQELKTYVEYDLNKTLDFASSCHGLEVRVPFLNKSVVEKALSIPRSEHINGMGRKSILKKFLQHEGFGDKFLNRPKLGFSLFSEPEGYEELKQKGIEFLKGFIKLDLTKMSGRDLRYIEAVAASFYCWHKTWEHKL